MPRNSSSVMGLPPFRGAVRQIILASIAIYVFILLTLSFAPSVGNAVLEIGTLDLANVSHGWVWQLVTYVFMAQDPWRFLISLTGIYFLGPAVEARIGYRRFWAFFFGTTVLSGLICSWFYRSGDRIFTAESLRSFLLRRIGRFRSRICVVQSFSHPQDLRSYLRAVLRAPQFLLSLEAPTRSPQIRSLHARPRPHRDLR